MIMFYILSFILGACVASFCGVVVFRNKINQSIVYPSSYCPSCNKPLKFYDNIPIFSYLFLRGKCRYCKAKIGIFSFIIELLGAILFLISFVLVNNYYLLIYIYPLIAILLIMAASDYYDHEIYNKHLLFFFVIAFLYFVVKCIIEKQFIYVNLISFAIAIVFFGLIKLYGLLIRKQDILGTGDIYFLAICAITLDPMMLLFVILVASLSGAVIELIKMKIKKENVEVAFIPYLSFAYFVVFLLQDLIGGALNAII